MSGRTVHHRRRGEQGLSLAEVLVALAVLAVSMSIALTLYDSARKSVKRGEGIIEQQQVVRIAADMIASDLRMAGFNLDPDGLPTRPDEAIEAAYDTAIVLRADFDAEDPAEATNPEAVLAAGSPFVSVSTGNDEIVAYVLAKPDGSSTDTLTFWADVGESPRDGDVEPVTIGNVALVHDDPPYTLYKVTLGNDPGDCCGSGFSTRMPLAENVRSMTFRYFDPSGAALNPVFDLTDVAEDIGGADGGLAQITRDAIRRVAFELEGLTREPDPEWTDPGDGDPDTRGFRKFKLGGEITPRNIGKRGMLDLGADGTPPSAPGDPVLVAGHCQGLFVGWPPNDPREEVEFYRVLYGTTPDTPLSAATGATSHYLDGLEHDREHYVNVQAVDGAGNASAVSTQQVERTAESTPPRPPGALAASQDRDAEIELTWDAVVENTTDLVGDPATPRIRDLAGYRVYRRSDDQSFTAADVIATVGPLNAPVHVDGQVAGCQQYRYTVETIDHCGVGAVAAGAVTGRANATGTPQQPQNVEAFFASSGAVRVTWEAVDLDADDKPLYVETYEVCRSATVLETDPQPTSFPTCYEVTLGPGDPPEFVDGDIVVPPGQTVYYVVRADACPRPNLSPASDPARPQCVFDGTVIIDDVPWQHPFWGPIVRARVTQEFPGVYTFEFYDVDRDVYLTPQPSIVDPDMQWFGLDPDLSSGRHDLRVTVYNGACSSVHDIHYEVPQGGGS